MTDKKISQLDLVTGVSPDDEMIINVGGGDTATTSRVSLATLLGGNSVSGIQYSAIYTASLDTEVEETINTPFWQRSGSQDSNGVTTTQPIVGWVPKVTMNVPIPKEADGAIIVAYSATAHTPSGLDSHPNYVAGSSVSAHITTRFQPFFTVAGSTMQPDFSGSPGLMGWADTHNTNINLNINTVDPGAAGQQKRDNFLSVNQITKLGFCTFAPGSDSLDIEYQADLYRAEFQKVESRPLRFIILPTQGVTTVTAAAANDTLPYPFAESTSDDYYEEVQNMHMREIRHIMTMMDAYEKANPGLDQTIKDQFDDIRTELLALGTSSAPTPGQNQTQDEVNGAVIKIAKGAAASLIDFDLGYKSTPSQFGLFG